MTDTIDTVTLATELTIAWLSNPNTRSSADDVPNFLRAMHDAVGKLAQPEQVETTEASQSYEPAVSARKSLANPDHIISMIDGKPYKTLRRHLATNGLTPDEYRQRYKLKADYPMVAESYSEARRDMAKKIGLGRKPGQKVAKAAPEKKPTPRKSASAAKEAAQAHLGGSAE